MVVCELIDIVCLETVKGCHMSNLMWKHPSAVNGKQLAASHDRVNVYEVDDRQPITSPLFFNHPHPYVFIG